MHQGNTTPMIEFNYGKCYREKEQIIKITSDELSCEATKLHCLI